MRLQAGTLLHGGTYKIEKVLGQGSFGITYLAVHTVLERTVCIKEFFMKEINTRNVDGSITGMTSGSLSYNYGQKFKKEALNLSRLDHPNIVRVTDSFEDNGTYYYVMDYIDGDNLNDYIKSNTLTQKEALCIIRDVATALVYMHEEKKMLHLDLKPGNIMRRHGDGHIFLIDFGLSKHYSSDGQPETSTSIGLGTAGYAPIEQANQMKSGEFRPTIDVYALGATLFKLLTRETPPQASEIVSDDELIESKLRANGITGPIIDLVVNAMLPNVRKRTQSIKAFLDSLPYGTEEKPVKPKPKAKKRSTAKPKPNGNSEGEETEVWGEEPKEININVDTYNIPVEYVKYPTTTVEKANNGDVDAMFALGMMFLRGLGVTRSLEYALPLFQKAQSHGDARAKSVIAQWDKLKKKYERKKTKTNVEVVEDNSPSWLAIVGVAALIGIFISSLTFKGCGNRAEYPESDTIDTAYIEYIDTMPADTVDAYVAEGNKVSIVGVQCPIGTYRYLGEAKNDMPNGYGEAWFDDGRYYKGYFTNGNLTGSCTIFRYDNGDSFEGSFSNNEFDTGTYTIVEDGSCFIGSFKDGQPEKGAWYDKNGDIIEEL